MPIERPTALVIGATGQTGRLIVREFDRDPGDVKLKLAARKPADVEKLRAAGKEAVPVDLDDPRTFAPALAGVERLFLLTGYTVDMLVQSKTVVDAAVKAGVRHIVHQGTFGQWDTTDAHFAWHQMIEKYIEASGVAWTHLDPNVFMEYFYMFPPIGASFAVFWGDRRVGWVAVQDIAAVAAAVLRDGPDRHAGRDYWLSTEVLSGPDAAAVLADVLGREIRCEVKGPDDLAAVLAAPGSPIEPKYAEGAVEFMWQVIDGRMGYIGTVRDDGPFVTGRAPTSLRQWATENRDILTQSMNS